MLPRSRRRAVACIGIALTATLLAFGSVWGQSPKPQSPEPQAQPPQPQERQRQPQTRPIGTRVAVPPAALQVDDGDTFGVVWASGDTETVRILGIDTPETKHVAHNIPEDQAYGPEARAFARGAVTFADKVELIRFGTLDPYGRTLGYFFLDGRNYSVAVVAAHLAYESVSHYGDNGFPDEAKAILEAAKVAGTPPFEPPHEFRRRMREQARGAGKP